MLFVYYRGYTGEWLCRRLCRLPVSVGHCREGVRRSHRGGSRPHGTLQSSRSQFNIYLIVICSFLTFLLIKQTLRNTARWRDTAREHEGKLNNKKLWCAGLLTHCSSERKYEQRQRNFRAERFQSVPLHFRLPSALMQWRLSHLTSSCSLQGVLVATTIDEKS